MYFTRLLELSLSSRVACTSHAHAMQLSSDLLQALLQKLDVFTVGGAGRGAPCLLQADNTRMHTDTSV